MTKNQVLKEEERKWRLPEKAPFPLECQQDAFSSGCPEKQEHGQNTSADCKTKTCKIAARDRMVA